MNGRTLALGLLGIVLTVTGAAAEPAASPEPQILGVEVGLGGRYRTGAWTPVRVTLRGGANSFEGRVSVTVPDSDGAPNCLATSEKQLVRLPAGETVTVPLYARFGRLESQMIVEFLPKDGALVRRVFQASATEAEGHFWPALPSTARVIGVMGDKSLGVEQTLGLLRQQPGEQAFVAKLEQVATLPRQWYGYESLDALVLSTSNPELYAGLKTDGPEIIALDKWLRMGGRLVLCVGSQAERILAAGAPLARFCPGSLQRMVTLRKTGALESFVGSSVSVRPNGRVELRVPQLQSFRGTVELRDDSLPLVIRYPFGLGQVIFVALDLDTDPLADWQSRPLLVSRLLDLPLSAGGQREEQAAVMHYGFSDIAGQLRSALDQYAGVWPVPFSLVVGLIVVYILLIGPIDYFFLRKLSPRMELTWLTFPLVVLAFSVAGYLLAYHFKGNEVRSNQVTLIDVDTEWQWVRGTSWTNVFSPRMAQYDLGCRVLPLGKEKPRGEELLFSWQGLPGGALGGMDAGTAPPIALRQPYQSSPALDTLREVPIPIWASKSFTARWSFTSKFAPEVQLSEKDQALTGRVINSLDFPLRDCLLVYGRWVYELGTLEPGQVARVETMTQRRELKTFLTGQHMVFLEGGGGKSQQETIPYDRASVDPVYILRMMMFFDAGGGRDYTGLMNRHQNFVDLSNLLKAHRAILVGTAPSEAANGAQLLNGGEPMAGPRDRQLTIYRFVCPVTLEP